MYNIKTLVLALLLTAGLKANAQTYCMDFEVVSNNGTQLVMNLYLSGSSSFALGSSNLVFFFNNAGLGAPVTLLSHTLNTPTPGIYQNPSITLPVPGEASFNLELNTAGTGKIIGASPTLLATIQFTILNTSQSTGFDGDYTTPPVPFTVVYLDDESTILQPGNGCASLSVPLPLELLSFRAKPVNNNRVDLEWSTAQEREVLGFDVERSADGHKFETIAFQTAKNGKSQTYRLSDEKPLKGVSYYRLKMKEAREQNRYSLVEVVRFDQKHEVRVFPNPVSPGMEVMVETDLEEAFDVTITDASGRQVLRQTCGGGTARLKTNGLSSGVYFYKVESKSTVHLGKITVQ